MADVITKKASAKARDEAEQRLMRLKSIRDQELARQQANRYQMQLDEDFYDGLQWDLRDQRILLERGQNPVVYNECKPAVDWMIGTERRTRIDHKVTPTRRGEGPAIDAVNKTKLLKYIAEVNRSEFTRSQAFDDALKAGLGWIEVGVRADPDAEPIYDRAESWRNVLYDSLGSALDLSDSRYLIRMRWLDLDIAKAHFPEHEALLERSAEANPENHGVDWWFGQRLSEIDIDEPPMSGRWNQFDAGAWHHNPRERVQCFEGWVYEPQLETTGQGSWTHQRVRMRLRCTIFTDFGILYDDWSPYEHNRFPLVPVWCYRRKRDGAPYGVIRNVRGPQEARNKRMSKALHVLSSNKIHAEADAVDDEVMDLDEIREENAAPDGIVLWGRDALKDRRVIIDSDRDIAQGHLALAALDKQAIRETIGVTTENLGRDTNLVSGAALKEKQQQGSLITAQPFDNLRLARQIEGELKLALIEQYYTEPKVFRITGERNKHDFVAINEPDPETGEILNSVTAEKANFVIDEQDYKESVMQAMFEQLMAMLADIGKVDPQFARNTIDVVMEYAPVPGKEALIKRIRAITGQVDPDEEDSPERQAAQEQAKALQEHAVALQAADLESKVAERQAAAELKKAQASRIASEISKLGADTVARLLEAIYASMQSAQVVATVPGAAPVADSILRSAGFVDQDGAPVVSPAAVPPAPIEPPAELPPELQPPAPPEPAPAGHQTGMMAGSQTPTGEDNVR